MTEVTTTYDIIWAIGAVIFGVALLIFRERFLSGNAKIFKNLYEKTNFFLFKHGAAKMNSTDIRIVSIIVAVVLIVAGVGILINVF